MKHASIIYIESRSRGWNFFGWEDFTEKAFNNHGVQIHDNQQQKVSIPF